jgi:hypothetical protein
MLAGMYHAISQAMPRRNTFDFRVLIVSVTVLFAGGCGDDVAYTPGFGPGTQGESGRPPPAPTSASMPDGPGATFAISRLILGRQDADGVANKDLWKTIGYNLDFTVTTRTSSGVAVGDSVCSRVKGASFDTIADGNAGRDNAFGSTVLPIMLSVHADVEKTSNALIQNGKHTLLVDVEGLGLAATYTSIKVRLYAGRAFVDAQGLPAKPSFDGSDVWPIAYEAVSEGMLDKPLALAADGYVAEDGPGGTLVAQFKESIVLTLDALPLMNEQGIAQIRIYRPLVTMRFSADRVHVDSGTIAGIIETDELQDEFARLTGLVDKTLCNSSTIASIRQLVGQSSDITADGQPQTSVTCNGISLGIQFQAVSAHLGPVLPPATPLQNSCEMP